MGKGREMGKGKGEGKGNGEGEGKGEETEVACVSSPVRVAQAGVCGVRVAAAMLAVE